MQQFYNHDPRFDEFNLDFEIGHEYPINMGDFQDSYEVSSYYSSNKGLNSCSPEYVANSDLDGSEKLNEESLRGGKSPRLMKKTIQKQFEPIQDNGMTYRYEDDPEEYKRARKRVQNRVSASRVRNKKKTYVEELEGEIAALKATNTELKTKNGILTTENNVLKQQIAFFERLFMKDPKNAAEASDISPQPANDDVQLEFESAKEEHQGYVRVNSSNKIKKHAAFLMVLTALLCVYGIWTGNDQLSLSMVSVQMLGGNNKMFAYGVNKGAYDEFGMSNMNDATGEILNPFSMITIALKTTALIAYVLYAVSFACKLQKHYQLKRNTNWIRQHSPEWII